MSIYQDSIVVCQMIKKTFIISTWSINELAPVKSEKTILIIRLEAKDDEGDEGCTFTLQPISRF